MAKVKITVVNKVNNKDLYGENPPAGVDESRITPECDPFYVGQEFHVDDVRDGFGKIIDAGYRLKDTLDGCIYRFRHRDAGHDYPL